MDVLIAVNPQSYNPSEKSTHRVSFPHYPGSTAFSMNERISLV